MRESANAAGTAISMVIVTTIIDTSAELRRWRQEEDRKHHQEEIRQTQRPTAVPADTADFQSTTGSGRGSDCDRHHASLPRRLMSRRIRIAATVRIGTMKSDTAAPSGISLP